MLSKFIKKSVEKWLIFPNKAKFERSLFLFLLCLFPSFLRGVDLEPWYPPFFEIQVRAENLYQYSRSVASSEGSFKKSLPSNAVNLNGRLAYSDKPGIFQIEGQAELILTSTYRHHFGCDSGTLAVRYQLWNDVALDYPVSIMVIGSLTGTTRMGLKDLTAFHHGCLETAIHLSLGKEWVEGPYWKTHIWGAAGLGCADVGSPWLHSRLAYERNAMDQHSWGLFVDGLFGFGGKSLHRHETFHGYGPIAHRSIDLSARYTYLLECEGRLSLSYAYRVYARNFPQHTQSLMLSFVYPIGL